MSLLWEHIHANWKGYSAVLACLVPVIFFTRKYTLPVLFLMVEFVIYAVCLHLFVYGVVSFGAWYKAESTFRVLSDGTKVSGPGWTTPLDLFWKRDLYSPTWLFYFEIAVLFIAVALMLRYRPLTVQRSRKKAAPAKKRPGPYSPSTISPSRGRR